MASESADPPAPQSQIVNNSTPNATARISPYTDTARTKRNVAQAGGFTATPTPTPSGPTTLGGVTVYDVPGVDHTPDNSSAVKPPNSPTAWKRGRDPYANGGGAGQPFLNNAG